MSIGVFLADDERLIRTALATLLPLEGDIEVVAEAETGTAALAAFWEHRPDVAILDLEMPELDGLAVASRILSSSPQQAVMMPGMPAPAYCAVPCVPVSEAFWGRTRTRRSLPPQPLRSLPGAGTSMPISRPRRWWTTVR